MPRSSTSWRPGQSGNEQGFPRALRHVRDAAREHSARAIEVLAEILNDAELAPAVRIAAAQTLLDRGWGRSPQAHLIAGLDADSADPRTLPTAALEQMIAVFIAQQRSTALTLPEGIIAENGTDTGGA